jgi:predicted S18 family serine protease
LKLQAEVVAAEKADMERRELQLSIQQSEMELADAIVEGVPIPLSSLPPALRESYEKGLRMAKEGPMPAAALRDLNEKYSPRSIDYLTSLGEGDEATQQLLWSSTRDIRKNVDEDVGEWMADPDNQEAIAKAVETAESQLLGDSKYRTASPENREIMAQDALVKVLRGMRADLDKLYEDAEKDADRDSAAATAQAKKVNEDRAMKYDAGMEPGGEQYNRARANAEKAKGESFDPEAFDASWDRRFFNPWGATELPAPIY